MASAPGQQSLRRSGRLRNTLESSGFAQKLPVGHIEQCCACLLDVDSAGDDGELLAVLDCCQPLHHFHVSCILMWTEQENSCPQCKRRYQRIGIYGTAGQLLRVSRVEERDQNFEEAEDAEASDAEDVCCQVCHKPDDESSLLLCDGRGGRCNAAYHYYCVGLSQVPTGDWFCPPCSASQREVAAARDATACEKSAVNHAAPGSDTVAAAPPAQPPALPHLWSTVKRPAVPVLLDLSDDDGKASSGPTGSSSSMPVTKFVKLEPPDSPRRTKEASGRATGSSGSSPGAKRAKLETFELPLRVKVELPDEPNKPMEALARPLSSPQRPVSARVEQPRGPDNLVRAAQVEPEKPRLAQVKVEVPAEPRVVVKAELPAEPPPSCLVKVESPGERKAAKGTGVKAVPGPEAFGGLCSDVPKWISRRGRTIRVDLGGRGMRDAAAAVLAKVVQASLEGLGRGSGAVLALDLAGNQLHKAGAAALLAVAAGLKLHVARLDLERNLLDPSAAQWLGRWCEEQVGGPPEQLYLSHNKIGDAGACSLLVALGRCSAVQTRLSAPLWVEVRQNRVRQIESVLDALSASVPLCLALDRSACGPGCCASGAEPRLHLFGIMDQKREDLEVDEEPIKSEVKREQGTLAKVKTETQAAPLVKVKTEPQAAPALTVGPRARADLAPRAAEPAARAAEPLVEPAPNGAGGGGSSGSDDGGREGGRGRGRGRGGRGGRGARGRGPKAPPALPPQIDDSHSWAQSLGGGFFESPPVFDPAPDPPASTGLWAMALARERQARRQAKLQRRLSRLESRISTECLEGGQDPVQSSQSVERGEGGGSQPSSQRSEGTAVRDGSQEDAPPLPPPAEEPTLPVLHDEPEDALRHALATVEALERQMVMSSVPPGGDRDEPAALHTPPLALVPEKVPLPPVREEGAIRALGKTSLSTELKELILARLHRERRLWRGTDEYERRVRRRCVCDQLCRKAQEKYSQIVPTAVAWAEHLRSAQGYNRTVQWVDKKIEEVVAKEASRQRGR